MDSFEATSQFSQVLRTLTLSVQSLTRAAHFALKNSDSEDYLFRAILDVIDSSDVDLNCKCSVFQLVDVLLHESYFYSQLPKSSYNYPYVHSLKNAVPSMILKVLPGSNFQNLYNVFTSLKNILKTLKLVYEDYEKQYMSGKDLLSEEDMQNIDQDVPFNEDNFAVDESAVDPIIKAWRLLVTKKKQSHYERLRLLKHKLHSTDNENDEVMFGVRGPQNDDKQLLTKKQILMRMEDDRESHKRSKESLWLVNRLRDTNVITEDEFFTQYWTKIKPFDEGEKASFLQNLGDLNEMVAASYKDKQF